jgi:dihydrofolate reductase
MPRKLVVTEYVSLDGVVEDPVGMEGSGLGDWTGPFSRGPAGDAFKHDELFESDALLLGRTTYEAFAAVWPTVKDDTGFAERINRMQKYVVSNSLSTADWSNTRILRSTYIEDVKALKQRPGGNILIYGSPSLVGPLGGQGLIEEYRLMTYPVVLGSGKRLFPESLKLDLKLLECRQLGSGIILSRYESLLAHKGESENESDLSQVMTAARGRGPRS